MEIREMLRQLRRGRNNRAVARALGIDRKTIATYRNWAQEQGLLEGALAPLGELHRLLEETMLGTVHRRPYPSLELAGLPLEEQARSAILPLLLNRGLKCYWPRASGEHLPWRH